MGLSDRSLPFVLVGAGRVGTAVSLLLRNSGATVAGVSSRTEKTARDAARLLQAGTFDFRNDLPDCDLVLIGAGEEGIADVAETLAAKVGPGTFVCHFAGSLGTEILKPLTDAGARPCAVHPVQACPEVKVAVRRLPGSTWGVTCADEDYAWAADFIARVDGRPVRVQEKDRPVWHAAAVSVSNGIAALMATGEDMLASIEVPSPHEVLGPLAAGTVANAREGGGGGVTLTGPVVRNEVDALLRHLEGLRRVDEGLATEYAAVSSSIVRAALRWGRLDKEAAELMLKALES